MLGAGKTNIPKNVKIIAETAFSGWDMLEGVTGCVDQKHKLAFQESLWLKEQCTDGFYIEDGILVAYILDSEEIIVPETVRAIMENVF